MKIKVLTIYTSDLSVQKQFYTNVLGLTILQENNSSFSIGIGRSLLEFQYREKASPYHFAINIPSNQEQEALVWLRERVEILKEGDNELVDFQNWNAKSIYFYDPDENILELIARKNLDISNDKTFGVQSLLCISEIGLPVDDLELCYSGLTKITDLPIYDGNFKRFCAVGDENGLFILVNKKLKTWFPTNDQAHSSDFSISFENNGNNLAITSFKGVIQCDE